MIKYTVFGLLILLISCTDNNAASVAMEQITIDTSNVVIDCNGGWYNDGKPTNLIISSKNTTKGWVQTQNVTIKNCKINGAIRVIGLGKNGEAAGVKASSITLGHTERAQAIAPRNIRFSNVKIEGITTIPIYLAPGATYITIENCLFTGKSVSVALYLDAESGYNVIRNNTFETITDREAIAVDGSAHNLIEGNNFEFTKKGGIYLYRNCGEGGTVRHQTPSHNQILNNTFNLSQLSWFEYGIWLGSRNGNRTYCGDDNGYDFGSSIDNSDFADFNTIKSNTFTEKNARKIKDNGNENTIEN